MSSDRPGPLPRRRMLGLLGAGVAGVVAGGVVNRHLHHSGSPPPTTQGSPSTTRAPELRDVAADPTTTTTEAPLPLPVPYQPVSGEVFADAKLVGARVVEALMTYSAGQPFDTSLEQVMTHAADLMPMASLAESATALHQPDADSVASVVYPQLGGLDPHSDPTTASVMVVVDQHLRRGGTQSVVSRCVDVRLRRVAGTWRFDRLEDTAGLAVPAPVTNTEEALRVLGHTAITMPDSVRWDIHDGIVDPRILTQMADLADQTPISVTTCMRGHPVNVFATAGRSAHSVGRAVDIWGVGGAPVVQQHTDRDSTAYQVSEELFSSRRVDRLGAPWAFGGAGGGSWTDPVHLDHLHLGVNA